MRKFLLFLFLVAFASIVKAAKVYNLYPSVDLSAFVENLKNETDDNVIINLSKGVYYLKKPLSFNVEHRVPIKIIGRGNVIITGAEPINEWELIHNGVWRTKQAVEFKIQNLIVNGNLAIRAKTPNVGTYYLKGGELISRVGNEVEYKAFLPQELENDLQLIRKTEKPVVNLLRLFTHSKASIDSYSAKEGAITFTEQFTQSYFTPGRKTGVVMENYFAALDSPGEWYQDNEGYVYYMPRKGECINEVGISASRILNLVTISGAPGKLAGRITFEGVVFEGCDVTGSDKGISPYQSAYTLDGAVLAIYAKDVNITNCEFRALGGYAIWIMNNCEDCTITRNYIHDIGGGGIKVGGLNKDQVQASKSIFVSDNVIESFGRVYLGASGVFLTYAHHCEISHNDISDGYYTGISVGFSWGYGNSPTHDNIISHNKITNLGHGILNDFAGIYTLGVSPGTIINNNLIYDIKSSGSGAMGIYTDEGSSDILIENNIVYNCTGGGFHQHYGSNNVVRNNIFAYGEKTNLDFSVVRNYEDIQLTFEHNIVLISKGDAISGDALKSDKFIFRDNCFYATEGQELTVNGISLKQWMDSKNFSYQTKKPRFRNPEQGDFRFKSRRVARTIGFNTIDLSEVGANWRSKQSK